MRYVLWALAIFAILALATWYEYALWHECLATNSWFYCMRVLGK